MSNIDNILETRLTTADVCKITTWSRWTLMRRINAGEFPPERVGTVKHDTWRKSIVAEWMLKNTHVREVA